MVNVSREMSSFPARVKLVIGHVFLFAAEADGLPDEQARDGTVGNRSAKAIGFAVGKTFHAERVVQAKSLPHQPINVRLGT